jgi:hypothetical protein
VIVSVHVATGAAAGALAGSRGRAVAVGAVLHALGDRIPHRDIHDRPFEVASGAALVGLLALVRGPLDPAVLGALASSAPDVEHIVRLPRPGGRKLYPSHRVVGWHRSGGISAPLQLLAAGLLVGLLLRPKA